MRKLHQLSSKRQSSQPKGFTMVEVMAAILMTTAFIAAAFQVMAINVYFKIQAKRQAEAMFWIQEDKEQLKALADDVTVVTFDQSRCSAYATYLGKRFSELYPGTVVSTPNPDKTIDYTYQISKTILQKTYTLKRTYKTYSVEAPPADSRLLQILQVNYEVIDPSDSNRRIEQSQTEVPVYARNACS